MDRFNRRANTVLRIESAAELISIKYPELSSSNMQISLEGITQLEDLYAAYLCKSVDVLAKRGLYREYVEVKDVEMISPKGRINIAESVSKQTMNSGKLICSYDELSDDVFHNRFIKTALLDTLQLSGDSISDATKHLLKKALNNFNGINTLENRARKQKMKFNNSNIRYKAAIGLCEMLISCRESSGKDGNYSFEEKLYILFKSSLMAYYKANFKSIYTVHAIERAYGTDVKPFEKKSLARNKYIVIDDIKSERSIIIGCIQYKVNLSVEYEENQLKELKEVVDEYAYENRYKTFGCLIECNSTEGYTTTDLEIMNVDNTIIGLTKIDLNVKWKFVDFKLKQVVEMLLTKRKG